LVAPLAAYLPISAMAGILFLVAWGLIDFKHIKIILRTSRSESAVLGTTFLSTLFLNLEFAIYVGVLLSLALYLKRTSQPRILNRVPDPASPKRKWVTDRTLPECPQLKIIRIDGSVFFGAVNHIQHALQVIDEHHPERKHVLIICKGINFADIAGVEMFAQEAQRRRTIGGGLYFSNMKDQMEQTFTRSGHIGTIGADNVFHSKTDAIRTIYSRLDRSICDRCDKRIFLECGPAPVTRDQIAEDRTPRTPTDTET
jgi:SulP family sulfate permease